MNNPNRLLSMPSKTTDLENEMIAWLDEYCVGQVVRYEYTKFFFEEVDDRIAFKLAWN